MPDLLSMQEIPDAERERSNTDEHGFRAAHRTMDTKCSSSFITHSKAAKGPPFTAGDARGSCARAPGEVFSVRERRREVVTR